LGMPSRVEHARNGGKIMIYESYSKGMYLTPNKSELTFTHHNALNDNSNLLLPENKYAMISANSDVCKMENKYV
jgi:hypothetical protein